MLFDWFRKDFCIIKGDFLLSQGWFDIEEGDLFHKVRYNYFMQI